MKNVDFVRSTTKDIDHWSGVVSCRFHNIYAFLDNHLSISDIVWRSNGGKQCDVDSKRFGGHGPTPSDPSSINTHTVLTKGPIYSFLSSSGLGWVNAVLQC